MSARERECGELPFPFCPRLTERSGGDFLSLNHILSFSDCLWGTDKKPAEF